jgi:hypothetical protein
LGENPGRAELGGAGATAGQTTRNPAGMQEGTGNETALKELGVAKTPRCRVR